jgi:hypothetical protein
LRTAFLLLVMTLFISLSCIVVRNDYFSLYMLPYVLIPLIVCTFYDARTANANHIPDRPLAPGF